MNIFSKRIKFVSATCPECRGKLKLDANLKTAYCQYCGAQCMIENAPQDGAKKSKMEMVLNFIERQQEQRREEKRRIEEEERRKQEYFKKYWWVYALGLMVLYGMAILMSILEKQGII